MRAKLWVDWKKTTFWCGVCLRYHPMKLLAKTIPGVVQGAHNNTYQHGICQGCATRVSDVSG